MCGPTLAQADWISPSRWIGTELRDYDRMPFTNTSSTQVSFYTHSPASCLLHVFLFGRPCSATPPWPDGDHRRLHNGGLCALSEWQTCPYKLLGTPHPHPGTQTHKQLDCITVFFLFLGAVFHGLRGRQTWRKGLSDRTSDYWTGMSWRGSSDKSVWFHPGDDLLFYHVQVGWAV